MAASSVDLSDQWISQSRATDWMRCPYRYQLVHVDRLVRRWTPAPMKRGTLVHAGLQYALWWDWVDARAARWVNNERIRPTASALAWGEAAIRHTQAVWLQSEAIAPHVTEDLLAGAERQVDEAILIFRRVWKFLGVEDGKWETVSIIVDGRAVPLIEHKMRAPGLMPGGWAGAQGTLDWVARERGTGHIWLFDLKTSKVIHSADYHFIQTQLPLYQFLLMRDGLNVVGTAQLQARAAVPQVPKLNKTRAKGQEAPGLSRSKIATDPQTYMQAILDNGLDPDDYRDVLSELRPFDTISFHYRSWEQVEKIVDTLQSHALNMAAAHEQNRFPRNAYPFGCQGCTHRTYCEADLLGEDTDILAETEYMREGEVPYPAVEFDGDSD